MEALGMIETRSYTALVEAGDVLVKTANVKIVGYEKTGEGIVTILIRGSVADCKIAIESAEKEAVKVGELLRSHVIPFPDYELENKLPITLNPDFVLGKKN